MSNRTRFSTLTLFMVAAFAMLTRAAQAQEIVIEMPATDLPANIAYNDDAAIVVRRDFVVPSDRWLHGYRIDIIDAQGKPVPLNVLHHISIVTPDSRELFSPLMMRVAAAAVETGEVRIPRSIGMPLKRGSTLNFNGMLHNPSNTGYSGVRIRFHLYTTSKLWNPDAIAAFPFHVHATPPTESWEFDVPPGRSVHSWEGSPSAGGKLVGLGGHMHQYGVSVSLTDVTDDKVLYEGMANRAPDGNVLSITRSELTPKSVRIRPDHVYRVTAVYDNPTAQTILKGGMGIVAGMVIPENTKAWPFADRTDPVFLADQAQRMGGDGAEMHHH